MRKVDIWIAAFLAVMAGLIFRPFAAIGMDPHHDGIMLKPALDVLSGQVLFRDTFSQYGPLTTYLQAVALVFSPTLLGARMLTVLAYAGSLFFLYLAWRSLLPRSLSIITGVFFVVCAPFYHPEWPMIPWSSTTALFFQAVAILALMRIVAGDRAAGWAWMLGAACSCTLWCRQPVGIILVGCVGVVAVALHLTGWRHPVSSPVRIWTRVAFGFTVITILILGHLAIYGALGAWWEQNILWPKRWALQAGESTFWIFVRFFLAQNTALILGGLLIVTCAPSIVRRFYSKLPHWVDLIWLAVLAVLYLAVFNRQVRPSLLIDQGGWRLLTLAIIVVQSAWVLIRATWAKKIRPPEDYYLIAVLSALSLGSAVQIYPVACANHIFWALAPGLGVFVYFLYKRLRLKACFCGLALVVLIMPAAYDKYRWGKYKLGMSGPALEHPAVLRGTRIERPELATAINRVQAVIDRILAVDPDQKVILYGDDAMYLTWFNNRENPSPYYITWSKLISEEEQAKRWRYVVDKKPVVLLNGPSAAEMRVIPADYELLIHEPLLALRIMVPHQIFVRVSLGSVPITTAP